MGGGFAAGLLASAVALQLLGGWPLQSASHDALDKEIVASHMRSMVADHLFDVASSNQHTVKPWFLGKLDYSPAVHDQSAQGFTLTGRRLDNIDGRPVAALVYSRGQHAIILYSWPFEGAESQSYRSSYRLGFNMLEWTQAGMRFYALSDICLAELAQFAGYVTSTPNPQHPPCQRQWGRDSKSSNNFLGGHRLSFRKTFIVHYIHLARDFATGANAQVGINRTVNSGQVQTSMVKL